VSKKEGLLNFQADLETTLTGCKRWFFTTFENFEKSGRA
jgi:hypothetical protein